MPNFHIDGDSGAIRGRTAQMRTKGQTFVDTGDALAKISTGGWTGRAADAFADKFEAEPERWRKAGDGFVDAAAALEAYADALDDAKRRADWAKDEYARGDEESESARSAYDADVSRARQEVADAAAVEASAGGFRGASSNALGEALSAWFTAAQELSPTLSAYAGKLVQVDVSAAEADRRAQEAFGRISGRLMPR